MNIESRLKQKVLVINRQWQGYEESNVQTALGDLYRGSSTAIDTGSQPHRAVTWAEWITLPIRDGDRSIQSLHGPIRIPTVICKSKYADMPKRAPKWSKRGVAKRDGYICQITGEYAPDGNVDHLHARKHGGRDTWENTAWMKRELNTLKKDKSLKELGWKLRRRPQAPPTIPMIRLITPKHADWRPFLCLE